MTHGNDPGDDAMREIEAALEHYAMACIDEIGDGTPECYERTNAVKGQLLALIRSKLPQPDAGGWGEDDDRHRQNEDHERAVEAWKKRAMGMTNAHRMFLLERLEIDEALRLMRARPASGNPVGYEILADTYRANLTALLEAKAKDEAAGELLRAAKDAWPWVYGHPKQSDELWQAIAKAERAGIKP